MLMLVIINGNWHRQKRCVYMNININMNMNINYNRNAVYGYIQQSAEELINIYNWLWKEIVGFKISYFC